MSSKTDDPAAGETAVEKADVAVAEAAAEVRHNPLVKALGTVSEIGDQPPLLAISAVTLAGGLWLEDQRMIRTGVRMLAAVTAATLIKDVIKRSVARTRPHMMLDEGRYEMKRGGPYEGKWNSFPSGHTAGAVAVARALVREYPEARLLSYTGAGVIAAAQIPRCAHYPSDVGAGMAVGLAAEALVDLGVRILEQRLQD